jgi:hypothetical protein
MAAVLMIASSLSVTLNSSRLAVKGKKERRVRERVSEAAIDYQSGGRAQKQSNGPSCTLLTKQS